RAKRPEPRPIEKGRHAGYEGGRPANGRDAPVELADEGAVGAVLRVLLDERSPGGRGNRQAATARPPNLGNEAPHLHACRAERQPDPGDARIRNAAAVPTRLPFERVRAQAKLPGRAHQRWFVGIDRICTGCLLVQHRAQDVSAVRASPLKRRRAQTPLASGPFSFGSAFKANIAHTSLATQAGSFNLSRGGWAGRQ